jgi:hypothetical protein
MTSKAAALILATLSGVVMLATAPAFAHHSGAMFDSEKTIAIQGEVKEFNWTNPHASFKVEVSSPGTSPVIWAIEMNSPNNIVHEGWKRSSLKAGDKIAVLINPLRDGQPGGLYLAVRLADGTTLTRSGTDHDKTVAALQTAAGAQHK